MMEDNSPKTQVQLSRQRLKYFFTHCAIHAKRISDKKKLKTEMSERITRLKDLSAVNAAKGKARSPVMHELEKLERRVSEIIDMESKAKKDRKDLIDRLNQKIYEIQPPVNVKPFSDFEKISAKLDANAIKLNKIGHAEEKIEKEIKQEKSEITDIENKLKLLEERYKKLSKLKGTKKEDLQRVKNLIDKHKKTVNEIKSR